MDRPRVMYMGTPPAPPGSGQPAPGSAPPGSASSGGSEVIVTGPRGGIEGPYGFVGGSSREAMGAYGGEEVVVAQPRQYAMVESAEWINFTPEEQRQRRRYIEAVSLEEETSCPSVFQPRHHRGLPVLAPEEPAAEPAAEPSNAVVPYCPPPAEPSPWASMDEQPAAEPYNPSGTQAFFLGGIFVCGGCAWRERRRAKRCRGWKEGRGARV